MISFWLIFGIILLLWVVMQVATTNIFLTLEVVNVSSPVNAQLQCIFLAGFTSSACLQYSPVWYWPNLHETAILCWVQHKITQTKSLDPHLPSFLLLEWEVSIYDYYPAFLNYINIHNTQRAISHSQILSATAQYWSTGEVTIQTNLVTAGYN